MLPIRYDISARIELGNAPDQIRCRNIAREYEHSEAVGVFVFGERARLSIAPNNFFDRRIALDLDDFDAGLDGDLFVRARLIRRRLRATEIVAAHENRHRRCVFRQEDAFLRCREAAADHKNFFAGKKFAVASRAIRHAAPSKFQFAVEADRPRMSARRQQHSEAFDLAARRPNGFNVAVELERRRLRQQKLRAERLSLSTHLCRQRLAVDALNAGIIDDLGRDGDLPAERFLFEHEHPIAGARKINCRRQTRGTAADDRNIIQILIH